MRPLLSWPSITPGERGEAYAQTVDVSMSKAIGALVRLGLSCWTWGCSFGAEE
jgi:hypothetical protein